MGRPKEFDSDTVLVAATDCFWEDGIARTSISSLVGAMNIQRSSFYNSFTSRERILSVVLDRYLEVSPLSSLINIDAVEKGSQPDLELIDLVLDFSQFLEEEGKGRGCLLFNGLSELRPTDGQLYEIFHDFYTRLAGGLTNLLDRIEKESDQSGTIGAISLHQMLCLLIGLSHFSKLNPSAQHLAKLGLDQLSGLSPHFADLIKNRSDVDDQMDDGSEMVRLQA